MKMLRLDSAIRNTGVYTITAPSGGAYVGIASDIKRRWSAHKRALRNGTHHCDPLLRASLKYGIDAMRFEVWMNCDRSLLSEMEILACAEIRPAYNVAAPGLAPMLGRKHNDETRIAFSVARRGRPFSDEHKAALSASLKRVWTDTGRENMACNSPEAAQRRAESVRKRLKGVPIKPEHAAARVKYTRAVLCVDTGVVYRNASEAEKEVGVAGRGSILGAIAGRQKSAYGFKWKWFEGED